jgi:hypothetical protein
VKFYSLASLVLLDVKPGYMLFEDRPDIIQRGPFKRKRAHTAAFRECQHWSLQSIQVPACRARLSRDQHVVSLASMVPFILRASAIGDCVMARRIRWHMNPAEQ